MPLTRACSASQRSVKTRVALRVIVRRITRMKVDTRDIRSATQAARNFGAIVDEVESGRTIVVVRNNHPVSVIAPVAIMERLDAIDEREEDVRLLAIAIARMSTTSGPLRDLDEVAAELGVDLDDLDEDEDDAPSGVSSCLLYTSRCV